MEQLCHVSLLDDAAEMLMNEARQIGAKLNPFDPTQRRAGAAMEIAHG